MIPINETLLNILQDKNLKNFTAIQLKNMCIKALPLANTKETGQLVYRGLRRLHQAGFIDKKPHTASKKQTHIFSKTTLFNPAHLVASQPRKGQKMNMTPSSTPTPTTTSAHTKLKTTLNQYQVDLLSSIGEAEEFKRLFEEYPYAKSSLYPKYMQARNQSSTLVGRIKAIEVCLNELQGLPS
ncbi:hypothetical protein [Shewanella surugensis]|uniref:Transcriptional regulator VspR n=1 Tax=Shewanella surugensis TaxID=212020 RepID=A0ABT0LCT7_9GAMM|nr:hypothetical protein [Shewanella surugensis]MCL1125521.1 hypothetical protein [Shewanella surugensis]